MIYLKYEPQCNTFALFKTRIAKDHEKSTIKITLTLEVRVSSCLKPKIVDQYYKVDYVNNSTK